jgi:nucleoporin NUP159
VTPLHVLQTESSVPVRQILPNPSGEPNLAQLVAVLHADGKVQILNVQMVSQCGWAAKDLDSTPVSGMLLPLSSTEILP